MKKIILSGLFFAFAGYVNAQLFVKNGSYVFMTNQYMTVMQDVNLDTSGEFFLRNTSQLLQKGTGAAQNTGTGKLSVFQEGTVNNYQYNYWCSPVGSGAAGNPFGITLLNKPTALTTSLPIEVLPAGNNDGHATNGAGGTIQIAPYWLWKFVALSPVYANWQFVGAGSTVNPGEGFTMKGTSGTDGTVADAAEGVANKVGVAQRYDFRGRPNDGDISVSIATGNLTLVGNPYPSAINLNQYLVEHTGRQYDGSGNVSAGVNPNVINGTAYFWEHSKTANSHILVNYVGGYGTYVANGPNVNTDGTWVSATFNTYNANGTLNTTGASSGSNFKKKFLPIGQGFIVNGIAGGASVMRNKYRVFEKENVLTSTFDKTSNLDTNRDIPNVAGIDYTKLSSLPVPQIKLHAILNNEKTTEVAMAFNPNTTDGYDNGYDAYSPESFSNAANMVYFGLDNNTNKAIITTLPFDKLKRIPIAFKCASAANMKVSVSDIINFNESDEIYLHDKETDVYTDIKNGEFNLNVPAGENNLRFEITFVNFNTLSNDSVDAIATSFEVFQNNANAMLTISNKLGKDVKICSVYDVTGKLVIAKKNLGSNSSIEIPTNTLSDGVYIVKLSTAENVSVEKKIIVGK